MPSPGDYKIDRYGLREAAIDLLARGFNDTQIAKELSAITEKRDLGSMSNMAVKRWREKFQHQLVQVVEDRRIRLLLTDFKQLKEASFKARKNEIDKMEKVIQKAITACSTPTDLEKLARIIVMKHSMIKDLDSFVGVKEATPEIKDSKKNAAEELEEMRVLVDKATKKGAKGVKDSKDELV